MVADNQGLSNEPIDPAQVAQRAEGRHTYRDAFLKLSGYKLEDLSGGSEKTRTFTTFSGGKYALSESGKKVRAIMGPATPRDRKKAVEEKVEDE